MQRILCTGDSHTWGQGAAGLMESFDPPAVGGELRLSDFGPGSYVNRLRRLVNQETGSHAAQWSAKDLASRLSIGFAAPCAVLGKEPVTLTLKGGLIRLQCGQCNAPSQLAVYLDGQPAVYHRLETEHPGSGYPWFSGYRLFTWILPEGEHTLTLSATDGEVLLYRLEAYSGPCAVINSGVGSCSSALFQERFWDDYVAAVQPDVVLMEAHTINDWLQGNPPTAYYQRLVDLIGAFQKCGSRVVLLTVSPVGGPQLFPGLSAPYDDYVHMSRQAARDTGIALCDANAVMNLLLEGMSEEQASAYLFSDAWHVNDRGHALYAQLLVDALYNMYRTNGR